MDVFGENIGSFFSDEKQAKDLEDDLGTVALGYDCDIDFPDHLRERNFHGTGKSGW